MRLQTQATHFHLDCDVSTRRTELPGTLAHTAAMSMKGVSPGRSLSLRRYWITSFYNEGLHG